MPRPIFATPTPRRRPPLYASEGCVLPSKIRRRFSSSTICSTSPRGLSASPVLQFRPSDSHQTRRHAISSLWPRAGAVEGPCLLMKLRTCSSPRQLPPATRYSHLLIRLATGRRLRSNQDKLCVWLSKTWQRWPHSWLANSVHDTISRSTMYSLKRCLFSTLTNTNCI
jgi:hypothetical protein